MSYSKSVNRKVKREVRKTAKKHPVLTFFLVLIFVAIAVGGYYAYNNFFKKKPIEANGTFTVHTLDLGNDSPGDATYINANGVDILIDAGSNSSSAKTVIPYLKDKIVDGVIEYVIVTHYDSDHIAMFGIDGGIFDSFKCEVVIDPLLTNKSTKNDYKAYKNKLEKEKSEGAVEYTAFDCVNNQNGAKKTYSFGENMSMEILDNYYYNNKAESENDYSICVLFNHGDRKFLFTGDLQQVGEEKLVERNNLSEVVFYKAGHHGSNTSSNTCLIDIIKPQIVAINCVAGGQYDFPKQNAINRIAKYTDRVYVTREVGGKLLNGTIIITSTADGVSVNCLNNQTLFKDTAWFNENRDLPNAWKNIA